ncbi:hypothetical protein [Sphingomonas sp.]
MRALEPAPRRPVTPRHFGERMMGKGGILWLLGVPLPVILILYLLFGR